MKLTKAIFLALIIPVSLLQCGASGFDRGPLPSLQGKAVSNDSKITQQLATRPQLPEKFKLAVYLYEEQHRDRLSHADLKELLQIEAQLKKSGVIQTMFLVRPTIADAGAIMPASGHRYVAEPLLDIRRQAARYGADVVLVLTPKSDLQSEANVLSLFYLTIVGIWIAPGSERDHKYSIDASMWDVRNGYLYATAYSEVQKNRTRPLGWLDHSEIIATDRRAAMLELRAEIQKRIMNLR